MVQHTTHLHGASTKRWRTSPGVKKILRYETHEKRHGVFLGLLFLSVMCTFRGVDLTFALSMLVTLAVSASQVDLLK